MRLELSVVETRLVNGFPSCQRGCDTGGIGLSGASFIVDACGCVVVVLTVAKTDN